jgi:hypothetical protein
MKKPESDAGWEQNQKELLTPDRIINSNTGEILWDANQEALDNAVESAGDVYAKIKKRYVNIGNLGLVGIGVSYAFDMNEVITAACIGVTLTGYGMGYLPDLLDKKFGPKT